MFLEYLSVTRVFSEQFENEWIVSVFLEFLDKHSFRNAMHNVEIERR